jgi:GNAT superfamily N-acetyltransferase
MADMLVRLYELPDPRVQLEKMAKIGVRIRRPNPWERPVVLEWVQRNFIPGWVTECEIAFAARPPSCFIAVAGDDLVGFACHDCARLNFFGPTGVAPHARNKGIGLALLLASLHAMQASGYAYAIIGGVGPAHFYEKAVGATPIERSTPGIYDFSLARRAEQP